MSDLVRFSVSLEKELLDEFDKHCEAGKYATRSEAIRHLLREKLAAAGWAADAEDVAASLTLVYDHHRPHLTDKLVEVQHKHGNLVVATMHVHLNHDLCMELIALRGPAKKLQAISADLAGLKGIHQSQLVIARAAEEPHEHGHDHVHPHTHDHPHPKKSSAKR